MSDIQIRPRFSETIFDAAPPAQPPQGKAPAEENPSFVTQNKIVLIIIAVIILIAGILSYYFFIRKKDKTTEEMADIEEGKGGRFSRPDSSSRPESSLRPESSSRPDSSLRPESSSRPESSLRPPPDLAKIAEQAALARQRKAPKVEEIESDETDQFIIDPPEEPKIVEKCTFKLRNGHQCKSEAVAGTEFCLKHGQKATV